MALTGLSVPQNVDFTDPNELKKLNSYLYKLSEEIMYMFNNISPADNFNSEEYIAYKQDLDKIASVQVDVDQIKLNYVTAATFSELKLDVDGIKLSYVGKNNIVQSINASEEGIKISGSKIELSANAIKLEGVVTANNNFSIDTAGTMTCKQAKITGTIDGSEIKGSTIHAGEKVVYEGYDSLKNPLGEHYKFEVGTDGVLYCQNFFFDNGGYGAYIGADAMVCGGLNVGQSDVVLGLGYAPGGYFGGKIEAGYIELEYALHAAEYVSADRLIGGLVDGSDRRIKKDIESIPEDIAVDIVKRLEPVSFRFKKNDMPSMGFIAQDVEDICKDLKTELPLFEIHDEQYYIAYTNYIPLLVRAVQKLLRERET